MYFYFFLKKKKKSKYVTNKDIDHMIYKYIKCIILKFVGYSIWISHIYDDVEEITLKYQINHQ